MIKQLIVIRRDLKMRRGKEIAQGAHAAMAFLTEIITPEGHFRRGLTREELLWIGGDFTKIVLQTPGLDELMDAYFLAIQKRIRTHLVIDNGTTEFNGNSTITALAIGPEDSEVLDPLFGEMKIY